MNLYEKIVLLETVQKEKKAQENKASVIIEELIQEELKKGRTVRHTIETAIDELKLRFANQIIKEREPKK